MRATTHVAIAGLALILLQPCPGAAQQESGPSPVEDELRNLGTHVADIVNLLEDLVAQRSEDLQLRRLQVSVLALQLRSSSISDIEGRIRTLDDRATSANEELAQLDAERERIRETAELETLPEAEREHLASMETMFEAQVDMIKQRIWQTERQIVDLQNDLAEKRRDVDILEEIVMEGLGEL